MWNIAITSPLLLNVFILHQNNHSDTTVLIGVAAKHVVVFIIDYLNLGFKYLDSKTQLPEEINQYQ